MESTLHAFLARVEATLEEALPSEGRTDGPSAVLDAAARHLAFPGGKRGRPLLTFHFGRLAGADEARLVQLAASAELVHTASLLHDDVVDDGTLRRGKPTANVVFGNVAAVLAGDLVLATALELLERHPPAVPALAVRTVAEMTRATIAEVRARGDAQLPLEAWHAIAVGKTGVLFALCGAGAALLVGDEAAAARWAEAGRHLGVLFQLADDLSDLTDGAGGKDRFADLKNRNPSHPMLAAFERSPSLQRAVRREWAKGTPDAATVARLGAEVLAAGGAEATLAAMRQAERSMRAALGADAARPGGLELVGFAEQLLARAEALASPTPEVPAAAAG